MSVKHHSALPIAAALIAAGLALAWAPNMGPSAPEPRVTPVSDAAVVDLSDDDPAWNCLTMGNRVCGEPFTPVSQEMGDALAEGEYPGIPDPVAYRWESCLTDGLTVVCPDGIVVVL